MSKTKRIALYAILTGILIISKEMLAFLPNIELVTFLIMMYALYLDAWGILIICLAFCLVQTVLYGTGMWTIAYFIIWPMYGLLTHAMRSFVGIKYTRMATVSFIFGMSFGFLSAIPYFCLSLAAGWSYFLRGIIFDIVHGIGNFIIMIVLFDPLQPVMQALFSKYNKS